MTVALSVNATGKMMWVFFLCNVLSGLGFVTDKQTAVMARMRLVAFVQKMNFSAVVAIVVVAVRKISLHINALEWKMLVMGLWIVFQEETNLSK